MWSKLKKCVASKRPSNKQEIIQAVICSWFNVITPLDLEKLVDSMPNRFKAVIKPKGYVTKY